MSAVSELFLLWREAENEFHWASADLYRVAMNTKGGPTDEQFDYTQHLGDIAKDRHSAYTAAIRSHGASCASPDSDPRNLSNHWTN